MSDASDRWARLTSRTFRWNAGTDTTGYESAECVAGQVTWRTWSHLHGEGPRTLAVQSLADLRASGPPLAVPARVLADIIAELERAPP